MEASAGGLMEAFAPMLSLAKDLARSYGAGKEAWRVTLNPNP